MQGFSLADGQRECDQEQVREKIQQKIHQAQDPGVSWSQEENHRCLRLSQAL